MSTTIWRMLPVAILAIASAFSWAQEAGEGDASPDAGAVVEIGGDFEAAWKLPAYEGDYDGLARSPETSGLLRVGVEAGDLRLASEALATIRPSAAGGQAELEIGFGENAVYWSPGDLLIGFGWQYFAWGTADGQNPTDNLNARDYRCGIEASKIPALALSATWYMTDRASIQCVAKPTAEASLFPVDFREQTQSGLDDFNAAFNALVTGASASASVTAAEPAFSPESLVAGVRLRVAAGSADLSISYLYDWDQYYTPEIELGSYAGFYYPGEVELARIRLHRLGLDAKGTAGAWGLWVEGALGLPEGWRGGADYAIRHPAIDWTAGLDRSLGPNESLYFNLQYLGRYVIGYDRSFLSDYPDGKPVAGRMNDASYMATYFERALVQKLGGQTEGLLQGLSARLEAPLPSAPVTPSLTLVCLVPFLYDDTIVTRYCSLALKPEIDIEPADSFHVALGAELCYAWVADAGGDPRLETESDRLGMKTPDNRVYLVARYSWRRRGGEPGR